MPLDLTGARADSPSMSDDALDLIVPEVALRLPRVSIGQWPTPIEPLEVGGLKVPHFVKREDLSAPEYGGNKVRCLEPVFGAALEAGMEEVWAIGAYGSNQALAIATHAPGVGLRAGALLFPQPMSQTARDNLLALATTGCELRLSASLLTLPLDWVALSGQCRARRAAIIPPGAAVPLGALGHVSAALEVALEVHAQRLPPLSHVVLPVGSTCTSAGLLVGFALAESQGLISERPTLHAVRISPWPVTARFRILGLAFKTARLLKALGGPDLEGVLRAAPRLLTAGGLSGGGYGRPTRSGIEAKARFAASAAPALDTTYSAKAAAHLFGALEAQGPVLFWSTKSSAPLATPSDAQRLALPIRGQRWLAQALRLQP